MDALYQLSYRGLKFVGMVTTKARIVKYMLNWKHMITHQNRYVRAALQLVLFSALLHLGILLIEFILSGDLRLFNYFNILDLPFFWPGIDSGAISHLLSAVIIAGIYIFFLSRSSKSR